MSRNTYINNTMSKNFIRAVAISILSGQLPVLLTPIFAGNFLGGPAIAAMALSTPVLELCYTVTILLVVGPSYLVTEYINIHQIEKASKHFTVSAISLTLSLATLSLMVVYFKEPLALFLSGEEAELAGLIGEYLPTLAWAFVPIGFFNFFAYFFQAEGQIKLTVHFGIVSSVLSLILTYVFLSFLHLGIASFSLAAMIGSLTGAVCFLAKMKSTLSCRFVPIKSEYWTYWRLNVAKGRPLMIDNLLSTAFFLLCNLIIVRNTGENGSIIWGVATTFLTISTIQLATFSESLLTIGQDMFSTRDYQGCRQIIRRHRIPTILSSLSLLVVVELFPRQVMIAFGAPELTDSLSLNQLRLSAVLMLVLSISLFEVLNYYLLYKQKKYLAGTVFCYAVPILTLLLFSQIRPDLVWLACAVGTVICLIAATFIKKDIDRYMDGLCRNNTATDMSVPYDEAAIDEAVDSIKSFLLEQTVDNETINAMENCVRALSGSLIANAPKKLLRKSFDLRAVKMEDKIVILFRYDGQAFNPIKEFSGTATEEVEQGQSHQILLRIFNHYARSPWYHYSYGVNTLSMTIQNDRQEPAQK